MEPASLRDRLKRGLPLDDATFDAIYPDAIREVSAVHWTPLRVCVRVVELLRLRAGDRFLDVGAGAGKLCIVAAASTEATVRGVEKQRELVLVARDAAARVGVHVDLVLGSFEREAAAEVDALYFFNPMEEVVYIQGSGPRTPRRVARRTRTRDVAAAVRFLETARTGVRVVTFCGFGAAFPPRYERLSTETWDDGALELWEKR